MMKYIKIKVYLTSFTVFSGDIKKKIIKKKLYKKSSEELFYLFFFRPPTLSL